MNGTNKSRHRSSWHRRLEQAEKRINDQREAKNKADYRRMLKDRLIALKRKDILDAKKQMFRQRGALHSERVRR